MSIALGVNPFDIVVFGGTGDLSIRKLMPALLYSESDERLPEGSRIIGIGRKNLDRKAYIKLVSEGCQIHTDDEDFEDGIWQAFCDRLHYVQMDITDEEDFGKLAAVISDRSDHVRVYYLATHSDLFGPISKGLADANLIHDESRVVLEKPLGMDLASAQATNAEVGQFFKENQIFRIDHYLGKETVQNLMVLRFANALFEPVWHHGLIDHVQITVAEDIGVQGRGGYYDKSGALRDMLQNHILQLLCLVAMEPPANMDQDSVRDEKLKILKCLRPFDREAVDKNTVRAQYSSGARRGEAVAGYLADSELEQSDTETFVAVKAHIENWRWTGVPFYLRTGKRMQKRFSEIVIQFKPVPHQIIESSSGNIKANRLVIRLQPDEGIKLVMMNKVPGPGGMRLQQTPLMLSFSEIFENRAPEAYERLILDSVRGNSTLFMRRDELEAAWKWVEPIMQYWADGASPMQSYPSGTAGPTTATALMARDDRNWHDDDEV